jgi:voltage-gated potassium channel
MTTKARLARWNKATELPLVGVALIFIIAYAWDVIGDLHGRADDAAQILIWATWGIFGVDYLVQLVLASRRWRWFYTHLFDFFVVALPVLRPLRLLRLVVLWTVLQRVAAATLRGRVVMYVLSSGTLLVFIAALAVLDVERHAPGAHIRNFGEALWWAFVTITTVGYGDFTPVTAAGRLVAVGLMIAGVALLGVVTATLASWLVSRVAVAEEAEDTITRAHLESLSAEIRALREELALSRSETTN